MYNDATLSPDEFSDSMYFRSIAAMLGVNAFSALQVQREDEPILPIDPSSPSRRYSPYEVFAYFRKNGEGVVNESTKLLDTSRMAKLLGVSEQAVLNQAKKGTLPYYKVGRLYRFNPQEITTKTGA
jgi:excisionase family DNA binding protein